VITIGIDPTIEPGPIASAWHGLMIAVGIVAGGLAVAHDAETCSCVIAAGDWDSVFGDGLGDWTSLVGAARTECRDAVRRRALAGIA
jgi:hypothetical protein